MFQNVRKYYSRSDVRFELVKQTYNREASWLVPRFNTDFQNRSIRHLHIHTIKNLDFMFSRQNLFEHEIPYNMYVSIVKYKDGIPFLQLDGTRKEVLKEWFKIRNDQIVGCDIFIDIDAQSHKEIYGAWFSTKSIIEFFMAEKVPFQLIFSGMGFHIIIPDSHIPQNIDRNPRSEKNVLTVGRDLAKELKEQFSELVDLTVFDPRRLRKLPYSLAMYEENIYLCYPFSSIKEFINFKLSNFEIDKISELGSFVRRGVPIFNKEYKFNPEVVTYVKKIEL